MAPKRLRCFVLGCENEHSSRRHLLPTSEPVKAQWLTFAFKGKAPPDLPKCIYVCSNHFTPDCFANEGQYKAGFAKKLVLKDGSVPTVRGSASPPEKVSISFYVPLPSHFLERGRGEQSSLSFKVPLLWIFEMQCVNSST